MKTDVEKEAHCRYRSVRGIWMPFLVILSSLCGITTLYFNTPRNIWSILLILTFLLVIGEFILLIYTKGKIKENKTFVAFSILIIVFLLIFSIFTNDTIPLWIVGISLLVGIGIAKVILKIWTKLCPAQLQVIKT